MARRFMSLMLAVMLLGAVTGSVEAKKKLRPKPKPAPINYYLNWGGDCAGTGFLALTPQPNPDSCALYFPTLGESYSFGAIEGVPMTLDATKPITVDFTLSCVFAVAADYEVVLEGTVAGKSTEIASATQTVAAAANVAPATLHYDLEPDAKLNGAKVTGLVLTVSWTNGGSYCTMDLESGSATMVATGSR